MTPNRSPMPIIPNEIIIEILSRLPVKSLVRFRCVCKSWFSLISHRQFCKKHLDLLIKDDDALDPWRLIIHYPHCSLKSCSLYSVFRESFGCAVDLGYPCKNRHCSERIIGSCNGLLCISLPHKFSFNLFLWNPSIKEFKRLPDFSCRLWLSNFAANYGFGYDCFGDDYKVVRIGYVHDATEVWVYSLRTDSWRKIRDFPCRIYSNEPAKFVKGCLNWEVTHKANPNESLLIVSFNLATEVVGVVPQPNYGHGNYKLFVRVLGDCLSVVCDRSGVCVDVWVMKEYGVKESWVKLVSLPYMLDMKPLDCSRLLCFLKCGRILMSVGGMLVLYDLNEKTFKYPMINGVYGCYEVDVYLETLVSPSAYNGAGR